MEDKEAIEAIAKLENMLDYWRDSIKRGADATNPIVIEKAADFKGRMN
jgi:hypothetical protein